MSAREVGVWASYREEFGSLNTGRRMEQAAATIAAVVAQVNGSDATYYDFAPHEEEPVISLEQALKQWT